MKVFIKTYSSWKIIKPVILSSHYSPEHNFYFPAQSDTSFKWTIHVEMPLGLGAPDTDMLWEASEKGELD